MISDSRLFNTPLTTTLDKISQWDLETISLVYQTVSHYTDEVDIIKPLSEIELTYTEGADETKVGINTVDLDQIKVAMEALEIRFEDIFKGSDLGELEALLANLNLINPYRFNLLTLWRYPNKRKIIDAEIKKQFKKLGWSLDFIENNVLPVRPEEVHKVFTLIFDRPYLIVDEDVLKGFTDKDSISVGVLREIRSDIFREYLKSPEYGGPYEIDRERFYKECDLIDSVLRDAYKNGCKGIIGKL
jgi:hypothetical protein